MARVGRVNAAAQLRAAPEVEAVQHRLADELAIQPDGEIHRLSVLKVPPGHLEEAALLHGATQATHVIIAPPAVPVRIQDQGVVGGDVRLRQRRQGQPLRLQLRDLPDMAEQLILGFKAVLGCQLGRAVL